MEIRFRKNMTIKEKGDLAEFIIRKFVPSFIQGTREEDYKGTDGYLGNDKVQIKADFRIEETGNFYFEVQEKKRNGSIDPDGHWIETPFNADIILFVTYGKIYLLKVTEVKLWIGNKLPRSLNPTSKGYLIPLKEVKYQKKGFPYFDLSGDIVIPFDSNPKYFYWKEGQKLKETISELRSS
jgi:hypothetical protein